MTFYKNNEGKLTSDIAVRYGHLAEENPALIVDSMGTTDLIRLLSACGGDTSKLTESMRQAAAIKAGIVLQKQEKLNKRRREESKARSVVFHKQIMEEIRQLSDGRSFTATSIQLAAANTQNLPVRSWQMYHAHLEKALQEGEPVKRDDGKSRVIVYVLKNGKERTRHIGRIMPSIWSFTD